MREQFTFRPEFIKVSEMNSKERMVETLQNDGALKWSLDKSAFRLKLWCAEGAQSFHQAVDKDGYSKGTTGTVWKDKVTFSDMRLFTPNERKVIAKKISDFLNIPLYVGH